ncbi:conserved exported protein of unknown function [Nitrospira sp. KM1]|uniref:hypothetical protein n=1 Tax=Nitrospira sp. KM1 TaxID=1936990 RepID=UPI0013A7345C|nr:hypothetical protein [Nitrospira sp. KM1]BCA55406.1 conserved exported protein of unknown function [Nitrospira sp. KM1]
MKSYSSLYISAGDTSYVRFIAMAVLLTLCTMLLAPEAWSQESAPTNPSEGGTTSGAAMGAAAGLSTLIYLPLKAVFAIGGGIVGGLAYAFSGGNEQAAKSIWTTSMYGTYIITPEHLRGDRPIRFLGVADNNEPAPSPSTPEMEPIR